MRNFLLVALVGLLTACGGGDYEEDEKETLPACQIDRTKCV